MTYFPAFKQSIPMALAASITLSLVSIANAQLDPAYPAGTNPGVQANPAFQSPSSFEKALPEAQKKEERQLIEEKKDSAEVKIEVPELPGAAKIASPRFMVNDIVLKGVTLFTPEELAPLLYEYKGKELTLDQLSGLVDALNLKYRELGYLTTQTFIPPQDIENGVVTIEVLEGRIGSLSISGNKYYKTWFLEQKIPQNPGDNLNIKDLEKTLNRINQQENFRLKAVLSPGDDTGETNVRLEVAERQPWQIATTVDNQGRPLIGLYRYGAEISNQNLTGIGDRLFLKWIGSEIHRTNVAIAGYTMPISKIGTELGYNVSYSRVNVQLPDVVDGIRVRGTSLNHSILLTQPLDKNRHWTADVGVNFRKINSFSNIGNPSLQLDNQTSIFAPQVGLSYDNVDRWGRTFLRGQMTFGAFALGGETMFSKYEIFFNRVHRLPLNNTLILRGYSQLTPDALPSAEQFQVGGAFSVRGFTEGLITGDRGFTFGIEDRFPIPFLRKISPYLGERIQGAVFADVGRGWLDQSNGSYIDGLSGSAERTLLVSFGTGLRARLTRFAQGFVDFGWACVDRNELETFGQPTFRVHFGIRSELLPDTIKAHDTGEPVEIKVARMFQTEQDENLNALSLEEENGASHQQAEISNPLGNDNAMEPVSLDLKN